jgi:TonB family protein
MSSQDIHSPAAPSPNALQALESQESRAGVPTGLEPGQGYRLGKSAPARFGHADDPVRSNVSLLASVLVHGLFVLFIGISAVFTAKRPSEVPVFEIVNLEKPKLRPLAPKVKPPPEPPPKPPEPVKPPEAPKLTPKPSKAPVVKKPEPKVVKEPEPDPAPEREVIPEQQVLQPQIVSHVPSDPRLAFWASRVKKKAETLWNPPTGFDILGPVKTVVSFQVTREGIVQEAAIATGSGNPDLDELALRTIRRMERVPPIPENYPEDLIQVNYEFIYKNGQ